MHIQQEPKDQNTIQSYGDNSVKINDVIYDTSLIVSRDALISPWDLTQDTPLTEAHFDALLELKPEIIILGSATPDKFRSHPILLALQAKAIGVECLDIGGAARTFNVLLGEHRDVVAGFIL